MVSILPQVNGTLTATTLASRKIFFIHIAKTGGSSFNAFIKKRLYGIEHCEMHLASDTITLLDLELLKQLDYISGHLKLDVFNKNEFSREAYFLMTFLRNPIDQLISHVNWIIHIQELGSDSFSRLSQEIQEASHEFASANLYDADTFISLLQKHQGFSNNQSRYFVDQPDHVGSSFIIERMLQLNLVGITEQYEESLKWFIQLNHLCFEPIVERENINPNPRIKRDILENPLIYDFLQSYSAVDIEVYNYFQIALKLNC